MKSFIRRYFQKSKAVFVGDSVVMEAISDHIEREIGPIDTVIHEIVSDYVHIDVHVVMPTESRSYYTLVTSGMSDKPMKAPAEYPKLCRTELVLCLPPTTKLQDAESGDCHWAVNWLRNLARFPHEFDTWLWWGHSVPNGDPPGPLSGDTEMNGVVLLSPRLFPESFQVLKHPSGDPIYIWAMVPVHDDEMNYKIQNGAEKLEEIFAARGITELLDVSRKSVFVS